MASLVDIGARYMASQEAYWLGKAIRLVSTQVSDLCRGQGLRFYDEMVRTDPVVSQSLSILKMACSANIVSANPCRTFRDAMHNERAAQATEYVRDALDLTDESFDSERTKIVGDALRYGEGMGELTYDSAGGRLYLDSLDAFDTELALTITDSFGKTLGYAPRGIAGIMTPVNSWIPIEQLALNALEQVDTEKGRVSLVYDTVFLPRWKVYSVKWDEQTSVNRTPDRLLDPAIQAWWAKQQMMAVLLSYVDGYALPKEYGTTSQGAKDVCLYDANDQPIIDNTTGEQMSVPPERAMLRSLHKARGGGRMAFPNGYKVDQLQGAPEWVDSILKALDFFNAEISRAITAQFLATSEGQRGSEKGAESHRDMLALRVSSFKKYEANEIRRQIFRPLVIGTYGNDWRRYTPIADLGDANGLPLTLEEVGFLNQSNYLSADQKPEIDRKLGLPVRNVETVTVPRSARGDIQKITMQVTAALQAGKDNVFFNVED